MFCMPVYVRCNGVYDCADRQDEEGCASFSCPGFYRCRASAICLHSSHVCDGLYQCPQRDDELFCHLVCPSGCTCHALAYTCRGPFPAGVYRHVRHLDASHSGMDPEQLANNTMLVFLSLAHCRLRHLGQVTWRNLHVLDLGHNGIPTLSVWQFSKLVNLRTLVLGNNPLEAANLFQDASPELALDTLLFLDLSNTTVKSVKPSLLGSFPSLQHLNLSHSGVDRILHGGLKALSRLRVLDLRGCLVTHFPGDVFRGLLELRAVYAKNYKLCCPSMLPAGFELRHCRAPFDEVSSCEALLRSNVFRAVLAVFASVSLLGNLASFVFRLFCLGNTAKSGYAVFVTHLSVSDFLMGVYLAVVGVADRLYLGTYLFQDVTWRHSAACRAVGFLSLLSSEVSALVVCLITLDRFLVLRFPFSTVRFRARSATAVCAVTWVGGGVLAAVPLSPLASHWEFYSQTGICIPLPVTRAHFAGHGYAFGVIIVLNFVLFLLVAAGQACVYWTIRVSSMALADSSRKAQDTKVARRLITIAVTDFVCWFPIGLLGLLASRGMPISGEASVALAIVALPLNSALNPFLYNLNLLLERRRRAREDRLLKLLSEDFPKD